MNTMTASLVLCLFAMSPALSSERIDLAGEWRLRLDPDDVGVKAGWPAQPLAGTDRIVLPNTTDRAGFGFALDMKTMLHAAPFPVTTRFPGVKTPTRVDEHGYLVRRHLFVGPAWYERDVDVPLNWHQQVVALRIERTMWKTDVWIDGRPAGSCDSLVAEHHHDLGRLELGRHRLTVRVDNRMIHNISTVTHAYGPETQTRWNGMIGAIELVSWGKFSLRSVTVYPAADRRSVRVVTVLGNTSSAFLACDVSAQLFKEKGDHCVAEGRAPVLFQPGFEKSEITLKLAEPAEAWDEFSPVRYRVEVRFGDGTVVRDVASALFGFRQIDHAGSTLRINGRPVFLRGTLDCCVYPETGHPPMTLDAWERMLGVVKQYGFNHVRFHTWCPPDAAFEAADRLGLYLQPETPAWVDDWGVETVTKPRGIGRDLEVVAFLRKELSRICAAYGNHPSFVMLTIGNEFGFQNTDWAVVNRMVEEIKASDPRRLYSGCTARRHLPADDYWVTHDSGAPTRGIGPAHTFWDFAQAASASPVPLIAHETGQRPVFPDYEKLLPAFTGPLAPLNLERYRRALQASGLEGQARDFVRASARFQLAQYKAEHEGMLRTRGFSGYQLLMLNDFTGQSEALVGVLDPFWRLKGVVSPADVRAWNDPTVILARFPKYVWTGNEAFHALLEVAHFGARDITPARLTWSLVTTTGEVVVHGERDFASIPTGKLSDLREIAAPLGGLHEPTALTLVARLGEAENRWNLWVYPAAPVEPEPAGVVVTKALDRAALDTLRKGGKVLWLAHGVKGARTARTGFESVYWSAGWWGNKFSSLGILCDPKHPALREFPNDGRSDWQWHDLCAGATTFLLDGAPSGFRPVVQPVPDFHFNTLLAQVFEAKVSTGSLLVCGYDLSSDLDHRPAARQFRRSLFRYAGSPAFHPSQPLPDDWLAREFSGDTPPRP